MRRGVVLDWGKVCGGAGRFETGLGVGNEGLVRRSGRC